MKNITPDKFRKKAGNESQVFDCGSVVKIIGRITTVPIGVRFTAGRQVCIVLSKEFISLLGLKLRGENGNKVKLGLGEMD